MSGIEERGKYKQMVCALLNENSKLTWAECSDLAGGPNVKQSSLRQAFRREQVDRGIIPYSGYSLKTAKKEKKTVRTPNGEPAIPAVLSRGDSGDPSKSWAEKGLSKRERARRYARAYPSMMHDTDRVKRALREWGVGSDEICHARKFMASNGVPNQTQLSAMNGTGGSVKRAPVAVEPSAVASGKPGAMLVAAAAFVSMFNGDLEKASKAAEAAKVFMTVVGEPYSRAHDVLSAYEQLFRT